MTPQKIFLIVAFIAMTSFVSCSSKGSMLSLQPAPSASSDVPPVIRIESAPSVEFDKPLEFNWIISNQGVKPVYIYTSLLETERSAFAELNIHEKQNIIEVGFLRSELGIGLPPYSFPKASFKRLEPNQTLQGRFITENPIGEITDHKVVGNELQPIKITSGTWTVQSKIAYGYEIESVQKATEESLKEGQEHPINPIVRWQKIAYSEPVKVIFPK